VEQPFMVKRTSIPPYDKPTRAHAVDGEVTLTGPGNIGLSLTPEAARASAKQIAEATEKAHRQREERRTQTKVYKITGA
jgi:hypothetical protein